MLYNNLSAYLKERYGGKIGKICIDGGFSCPNRDGKCGTGGCIYCGERGAGEHIDPTLSIAKQVRQGLERGRSDGYIAYFQSFTNTYAPLSVLRERYDAALTDERIVALAIGTRPDCITEEIADLLKVYSDRLDVWVELGLQSASDKTADIIGRGYPLSVYYQAAEILNSRDIPFVTHMIIGLPGESESDIDATVDAINTAGSWGVKIHSLYVMRGTRLADMYSGGKYTPIAKQEYIRLAVRSLLRLRPDMIIHRLTGDCPSGLLLAPDWNTDKNGVIEGIRREISRLGFKQGALYKE